MNPKKGAIFSDEGIQRLFGHEAAEDEDPERLRSYYFKSSTYDHVVTPLPLRILVGHKGIGKSALFQIAMAEDKDSNRLSILIKPDDVVELEIDTKDFLKTIRIWKAGITQIIAEKAILALGASKNFTLSKLLGAGTQVINLIADSFKNLPIDLDPSRRLLVDQFQKRKQVNVYIDDLDRGWQGHRNDVLRISALLNAVRDISIESRGIFFKISLRSDVYFLVRTSDESTDKIEGSVVWQYWSNHEIFVLLVKRVETYFGREIDEDQLLKTAQPSLARYLDPIMESRFMGQGLWQNAPMYRVLMSLTRKRPRDLVKLCSLAAREAQDGGSDRIRTNHFKAIFPEYSQGRLQDAINEFRSELPDIGRLLINMKPDKRERTTKAGYVYKTDALLKKIERIQNLGRFRFSSGQEATLKELAGFMYKINFLTARKENTDGVLVRKYFEENRYLSNEFSDFGFDWEIHPAYRWALQPETIDDVFRTLQLEE